MRVLGIIAEYNPFHNGHLYHLRESVRLASPDYTLCVMSGDFTQRGEPAMTDKWIRAEAAVRNGVDLVLELPFAFACNNAEYFAAGAVDILNRLGCVTHLSFGSEAGELDALTEAAEYLAYENEELKESIREFADKGVSFPRARYEAVKKCRGDSCSHVLKSANNILAVEYLKQLHLTKSRIEPLTVKRYGTGYHDEGSFEHIASATAIRRRLKVSDSLNGIPGSLEEVSEFVPDQTYQVLHGVNKGINITLNHFYPLMIYRTLTSDPEQLGSILSATEGLENRVLKAAARSGDMEALIRAVRSKRYTLTRIQRLLVHTLIGLDKEDFRDILNRRINYARVLGFSKNGAALLKRIKKEACSSIPVLTNINRELSVDAEQWKLLNFDVRAADIYNLTAYGETYMHSDYVMKPFKDFDR
ncbi:MAG TPA: nucleotidyltransferase [Anaerovoracaceae bacterium]|nr:nucleotidyltransferase [Anaerovoracaceae bacterium]